MITVKQSNYHEFITDINWKVSVHTQSDKYVKSITYTKKTLYKADKHLESS